MANYSAVRAAQRNDDADALRAAMHVAFEDQLVQKIIEKLPRDRNPRGRRPRSTGSSRLVVVEGVERQPLNFARDFELANQLGYGLVHLAVGELPGGGRHGARAPCITRQECPSTD